MLRLKADLETMNSYKSPNIQYISTLAVKDRIILLEWNGEVEHERVHVLILLVMMWKYTRETAL